MLTSSCRSQLMIFTGKIGSILLAYIQTCKYIFPGVLLATDFISDASDTAKVIYKTLKNILEEIAHKGVKVINGRTKAVGTSK